MTKPPNRRRRVLIDELQYRLFVINTCYFIVILMIFVAALFTPLVWPLVSPSSSTFAREAVASQFLWLNQAIWLPSLIAFVCLGVHSVFVSHRIAGPLYQLRRLLRVVADGNLTVRAALREKDYLRKEEAAINEMIAALSTRIEEIERPFAELRQSLDALRQALDAGATIAARERLGTAADRAEMIRAALGRFQTRHEAPEAELAVAHAS